METLRNHTLVYDSECPMCDLYTKGFIAAGMLDNDGRIEYGCARVPASFNNQRARNEIALVDYENGTVTYGIDSLFKVIGYSIPFFKPVFGFPPVHYLFSKLYSFISYNRKVIAPPSEFEPRGSCTPAYHVGYRLAYIAFAWLIASLVLTAYASLVYPLIPRSSFAREFMICAGQIFFQVVFVRFMTRDRLLHYIGNMMTVSLIGALLLLPALIVGRVFGITQPWFFLAWFGLVVAFMVVVHWRRVKMLGIGWGATASWIAYRILVLWIILV
ncbi:MAG TPA: hypothetical protein VK508_11215 [Cyclobacteriaceae bacterium]|nr:hypothetical protein [Cyclobacteriaceae bacterium]